MSTEDDGYAEFARQAVALGGSIIPKDDEADIKAGAKHIPSQVTCARRDGQRVDLERPDFDDQSTWYWTMPDGSRVPYGTP